MGGVADTTMAVTGTWILHRPRSGFMLKPSSQSSGFRECAMCKAKSPSNLNQRDKATKPLLPVFTASTRVVSHPCLPSPIPGPLSRTVYSKTRARHDCTGLPPVISETSPTYAIMSSFLRHLGLEWEQLQVREKPGVQKSGPVQSGLWSSRSRGIFSLQKETVEELLSHRSENTPLPDTCKASCARTQDADGLSR